MALSPTSGGVITLLQAQTLIRSFNAAFSGEIKASFMGSDNNNLSLNQNDCIGIRMYNGYDDDEKRMVLVMVGVDSNGKDIAGGYIMDRMIPCPSSCDTVSPLYI